MYSLKDIDPNIVNHIGFTRDGEIWRATVDLTRNNNQSKLIIKENSFNDLIESVLSTIITLQGEKYRHGQDTDTNM